MVYNEVMLTFPIREYARMIAALQAAWPAEGCGFLAGADGRVSAVYPVANQLARPDAFRMAGREQVEALLAIEAAGLELLAIYHSHPAGKAQPSSVDIAAQEYDVAQVIVSLQDRLQPVTRGYRLAGGEIQEIPIRVQR